MFKRVAGEVHGRTFPALFLAFFLITSTALAANPAGRTMPLPESPPTAEEMAAARGMEQMLVDMMIQEMRKSVPESEVVPLSQGERVFRQMLDQEYSRMISESGGVGVAELVLAQIRGKR